MADETQATEPGAETGADAAHGAADAAHGGAEAVGMPQLDFATFPNQIFWLVVTLVAIYFILSKVALPRIATVLAERQGTITNDIAAAEDLKLKAKEAENAYDKALAEARSEAQKIIAAAKAEIQAELADSMKIADAEIEAKAVESEKAISEIRKGAVESIREVAGATAGDIVALLGGSADAKGVTEAITGQMKGVAK